MFWAVVCKCLWNSLCWGWTLLQLFDIQMVWVAISTQFSWGTRLQFHRGFWEYIQVWCWWGPCLLHDLPDCTELGSMVLNSTVGGAGWGTYLGVPNATFLTGSLSLSLPCCSSCSLVVSSFLLLFSSSCLASLKGAFKEAGTFLLFPFAAVWYVHLCKALTVFDWPPPTRIFRPSFSARVALLQILQSCQHLGTN